MTMCGYNEGNTEQNCCVATRNSGVLPSQAGVQQWKPAGVPKKQAFSSGAR